MSIFVGVEAVGFRQCAAVASDGGGNIRYAIRRIGEPILLHSTERVLLRKRLLDILKDITDGIGCTLDDLVDATVCIGIAGAPFPSELTDLHEEFSKVGVTVGKLICKRDVDIALVSHLRKRYGSVIMCSSGASVFLSVSGRQVRLGGWGPAIGERGSGYWVGRQAIEAIAEEYVRPDEASLLWHEVVSWLKSIPNSDYPDLQLMNIRWQQYRDVHSSSEPALDLRPLFLGFINHSSIEYHRAWRCFVSYLCQPVLAAANKGDVTAAGIVERTYVQLADQYQKGCEIAVGGMPVEPIVLHGGVLSHNRIIRESLKDLLNDRFKKDLSFVT